MKKMTKREKFELLLTIAEVQENEMLVEFINHELELLAKKNATGTLRKPTKTQLENGKGIFGSPWKVAQKGKLK